MSGGRSGMWESEAVEGGHEVVEKGVATLNCP